MAAFLIRSWRYALSHDALHRKCGINPRWRLPLLGHGATRKTGSGKSKMAAPMKGCYGATRWLLRSWVAKHVLVARHVTVVRHVLVVRHVRTRTVAMALRTKPEVEHPGA